MKRPRGVRSALALFAVATTTACTTTVAGEALMSDTSPEAQGGSGLPGLLLQQEPGEEGPFEFGGTPAYEACHVLSMADAVDAGYLPDSTEHSQSQLINWHQIADGKHDPAQRARSSNSGQSVCGIPGPGTGSLYLMIHQPPFDHPEAREVTERNYSRENSIDREIVSEKTVSGTRIVIAEDNSMEHSVGFFAEDYYAILLFRVGDATAPGRSPEEIRDTLAESVARKLAEGPTPPARYSYAEPYSWAPPPCELYTTEDYRLSFDMPDISRVEERYNLTEEITTPSVQGGTQDQEPRTSVSSSCRRENEQAANSDVGDSTVQPQGMEVTFTHFLKELGAEQSNNWDCNGDKEYDHPFGPPIPVPVEIGDGHTCFINFGDLTPVFTFKLGRTKVEMNSWNSASYDDAKKTFEEAAKSIAERLARQ